VVLGPAAGPYDDVKAWWVVLVVAGTLAATALVAPGAHRPPAEPDRLGRALRAGVVAYAAWYALTTALSLSPPQSLVGYFGRGLGLLAFLAALAAFPLTLGWAARADRARAAVDAVLWGSAPVCLLALGQIASLDPLPPSWDPVVAKLTVRSTFGQHIFLGSYLVILAPLTLGRLGWALAERSRSGPVSEPPDRWTPALVMAGWAVGAVALVFGAGSWPALWWALGPWAIGGAVVLWRAPAPLPIPALGALLAAQALVIVASQARGAFLALLAGLAVAGVPVLWALGARKTLMAGGAVVTVLLAVIVLLNVPGSPFALSKLPLLRRMDQMLELKHGSPEWFRVQVWAGILDGWRALAGGEPRVPEGMPRVRAAVGYGLETQIHTLSPLAQPGVGVLAARGQGFRGQYLVDRAHSVPLDHLVTGGVGGLLLWTGVTAGVLWVGVRRVRSSGGGERMLRLGALGAVTAHALDGAFGIDAPVPLALHWLAAALLVSPPWSDLPAVAPARGRAGQGRWLVAVAVVLLALGAVVASTRWLQASLAYAGATRATLAGRLGDAVAGFARARALMPWVSLSGEGLAAVLLRVASLEPDARQRRALLRRVEAVLAETRAVAGAAGPGWTLAAQTGFARVRMGERERMGQALEAFDRAVAWRPADPALRSQLAWALLEQGAVERAGDEARIALALSRDREWLAWAILARTAALGGDAREAERAAQEARKQAPPEARETLARVLP